MRAFGAQSEHHTGDAIALGEVGTHFLPDVVMVPFGEQVAIHLAHPFHGKPRVVLFVHDPAALDLTR